MEELGNNAFGNKIPDKVQNDNDSVYSEDPKMYEILGIEKKHKTLQSGWDMERIVGNNVILLILIHILSSHNNNNNYYYY